MKAKPLLISPNHSKEFVSEKIGKLPSIRTHVLCRCLVAVWWNCGFPPDLAIEGSSVKIVHWVLKISTCLCFVKLILSNVHSFALDLLVYFEILPKPTSRLTHQMFCNSQVLSIFWYQDYIL